MTTDKAYFQSFYKLSQAFGTAAGMDELLELIVKSAVETMSAKAACLFLADKKQDIFVPKAQHGLSENYLHASPLKARHIVDALAQKGSLVFEDAVTDPRLEHHAAKKAEGIASLLTVPVRTKGRCIGVLSLYTAKKRKFSKDEIEFLSALAASGGTAITNTRLLERIQNNSNLFLELATAINSSLDIKQILHGMSVETCKALGMEGVTIRLRNDDTGTLDLVASHGLSDRFVNKGAVSAEKSVAAALKGESVVIDDVANDKRLQYREEVLKEGIASMVCVPIRSKEAVIGVMRLYSKQKRKYPQDFLTTVNALAQTGALAIQNASMYLMLKEDHKSLEEDIWRHRAYF
jgi:GAF domain-containing protein